MQQAPICRHCGAASLIRNGKAPNGKQKYMCRVCGRQSRDNPESRAYSTERREEMLRAYHERSSLRGVERTFGVARTPVIAWLKKKARQLNDIAVTLPTPIAQDTVILELDEMWSFVQRKDQKRWIWLALSRATRHIVAFGIGDRSAKTCQSLWDAIPQAYRHGTCYSDFWSAYQAVIPDE